MISWSFKVRWWATETVTQPVQQLYAVFHACRNAQADGSLGNSLTAASPKQSVTLLSITLHVFGFVNVLPGRLSLSPIKVGRGDDRSVKPHPVSPPNRHFSPSCPGRVNPESRVMPQRCFSYLLCKHLWQSYMSLDQPFIISHTLSLTFPSLS